MTVAVLTWTARLRQRAFRSRPADRAPVVLRHSRIYILPTRRGFAIIATLILMLLTSLNYALSLGLALTFFLGGLVAAALLHTFRNLAGLEIKPLAGGEAFAGEPLAFSVALAAGAIARRAIELRAAGAMASVSLVPYATQAIALRVPTQARGRIALGRITLSSDQPLGLWRGFAYVHFPLTGVVFPAPELNAPPPPAGAEGAGERTAGASADSELAGLRDYQPGDPLQRVAWKAVARGAGWFSKSFEGSGGQGTVELAWASVPAALAVEARLARLTAWVLACERAARPFALTLPGLQLRPALSREHLREALTALALFDADTR